MPATINFHAIYKGKKEQLSENKGKAYGYIVPNGLVEDVLIHMMRIERGVQAKVSFSMQPFFGTFEMHENFIKPGRVDE